LKAGAEYFVVEVTERDDLFVLAAAR